MNVAQTTSGPPQEAVLFDRLRLLRSRRVGIVTYRRLMAEHGTAAEALRALPDVAREAGVADYAPCPEAVVAAEIKAARAIGARLLAEDDPDWPAGLATLDDAPPLLWTLGDTGLLGRPMIALVGARNASSLGTRMAKRLASDLGEAGFVVVSGLARGIDAAAHHAALPTGTVAVQAGGIDVLYPAENADLGRRIGDTGLRLTEMPMGLQPQARHFPARNRIVAGLAGAVVVVEAAAKSGSLITARSAIDNHREVLAVPGHPFDARASGCNMLIRDGALLVRSAADVIEAVGPLARPAPAPRAAAPDPDDAAHPAPTERPGPAGDLRARILSRLGPVPLAEDQLIRDLAAPARTVAPALTELELEGRITRQAGGLLVRSDAA